MRWHVFYVIKDAVARLIRRAGTSNKARLPLSKKCQDYGYVSADDAPHLSNVFTFKSII